MNPSLFVSISSFVPIRAEDTPLNITCELTNVNVISGLSAFMRFSGAETNAKIAEIADKGAVVAVKVEIPKVAGGTASIIFRESLSGKTRQVVTSFEIIPTFVRDHFNLRCYPVFQFCPQSIETSRYQELCCRCAPSGSSDASRVQYQVQELSGQ
jgi:hypothetical protein